MPDRGGPVRELAHDVARALAALYEGILVLYMFDRQTAHMREHTEAAVRLLLDGLRLLAFSLPSPPTRSIRSRGVA